MKKVLIYQSFERFWHWTQALLILFLMLSGFEIHGSISFFGFANAVTYHNVAAWAFMILIVFAIFWHFTTGEWKQYVPTFKSLKAQMDFYLFGIFRNAPHPTKKTVLSKLNPLQRLTYLGLKVFMIPIMVISGILYMLYRYPQKDGIMALNIDGLEIIAVIHTLVALLLIAFVIVHIYLKTTGHTMLSNLQAMLTGYEELEPDEKLKEEFKTTI